MEQSQEFLYFTLFRGWSEPQNHNYFFNKEPVIEDIRIRNCLANEGKTSFCRVIVLGYKIFY